MCVCVCVCVCDDGALLSFPVRPVHSKRYRADKGAPVPPALQEHMKQLRAKFPADLQKKYTTFPFEESSK